MSSKGLGIIKRVTYRTHSEDYIVPSLSRSYASYRTSSAIANNTSHSTAHDFSTASSPEVACRAADGSDNDAFSNAPSTEYRHRDATLLYRTREKMASDVGPLLRDVDAYVFDVLGTTIDWFTFDDRGASASNPRTSTNIAFSMTHPSAYPHPNRQTRTPSSLRVGLLRTHVSRLARGPLDPRATADQFQSCREPRR